MSPVVVSEFTKILIYEQRRKMAGTMVDYKEMRRQIESSEDLPTEEEILLEKLRKIDIAVGE